MCEGAPGAPGHGLRAPGSPSFCCEARPSFNPPPAERGVCDALRTRLLPRQAVGLGNGPIGWDPVNGPAPTTVRGEVDEPAAVIEDRVQMLVLAGPRGAMLGERPPCDLTGLSVGLASAHFIRTTTGPHETRMAGPALNSGRVVSRPPPGFVPMAPSGPLGHRGRMGHVNDLRTTAAALHRRARGLRP